MRATIGNKGYLFGKSKNSGKYAVWEQKKTGYVKIAEFDAVEDLKKYRRHLYDLADKRTMRHDIADLCGTSYAAAKLDMGL